MSYISGEGAKVLHDRCVELAEKYNMPIIAASTFNKNKGTEIANNMEETLIKSIIKNDNILVIQIKEIKNPYELLKKLTKNKIKVGKFNYENKILNFTANKENRAKLEKLLDKQEGSITITPVTKISIVGSGVSNHMEIIEIVLKTLEEIKNNIIDIDVSACKISILFDSIIDTKYLNELHNFLLEKKYI